MVAPPCPLPVSPLILTVPEFRYFFFFIFFLGFTTWGGQRGAAPPSSRGTPGCGGHRGDRNMQGCSAGGCGTQGCSPGTLGTGTVTPQAAAWGP